MRRILLNMLFVAALVLMPSQLRSENKTLRLTTGQLVTGEIVFENEEVVVIRDAEGARFQYQRSMIEQITDAAETKVEEPQRQTGKAHKVSLQLHLSGGAADVPGLFWAGSAEGLVSIGANNLLDKGLFLGGAVGYEAAFHNKQIYSFIPIALVAQIPLLQKKHSPFVGAGIGYGISAGKSHKGGMYASADIGYRWQTNGNASIALAFHTAFQQTRFNITETIQKQEYTNNTGRCFVNIGRAR